MAVLTNGHPEPRPGLVRSNTDYGPRNTSSALLSPGASQLQSPEDEWKLRHGFEETHTKEALEEMNSRFWIYYTDKRHETGGKPKPDTRLFPKTNDLSSSSTSSADSAEDWRVKSRIKTVFAGLMLCLNIGVDPPDVIKTKPTATLEAWVDPESPSSASTKIMETIGKALQAQYETLSMRIRYKQFLDPSVDETRRCCQTLRRNSKDERVLFHYNGHGVPLPTPSGEIWYFNRNYTQYIPVSLYDLQLWLGGPSIYVLDVSHAGNVVANFGRFIEKHEAENVEALEKDPNAQVQNYSENIILAACGKNETLPTNPKLPADLFTSCLTTPVAISLRCFFLNSQAPTTLTLKDLEKVPGRLQERRTPLGELNWIFTAITDTIAWNCLPREIFKKLFRQDLMVAALFRNYLLADRIMRANGCHPETEPRLPSTHMHPLWQSWDLALEMVLTQLPAMIASEEGGPHYEYQHSTFFAEQLTAFEVYLGQGAPEKKAPDQLPIVLQVLLSQVHRLRALVLLSRFLDLGPWAVNLALKIGIFPYVLKLLQSAADELKPVLIFIWTRILAVDQSCQGDLLRDNGYKYFLSVVRPDSNLPISNKSEHRAMSAFIVAMFCKDFHQAQTVSMSAELFQACIGHLRDVDNPLLRQWSCLCISMLWKDYPEAKWVGTRASVHQVLCQMVYDPVPEVRASAIHALTNYIGHSDLTEQVAQTEQAIASALITMSSDGSSMVRNELLVFFSAFIARYQNKFVVAAFEELMEETDNFRMAAERAEKRRHPASRASSPPHEGTKGKGSRKSDQRGRSEAEIEKEQQENLKKQQQLEEEKARKERQEREHLHKRQQRYISRNSVFSTMWKHLLILSVDPHADVSQNAEIITDYIHIKLLESPLGPDARVVMEDLIQLGTRHSHSRQTSAAPPIRFAKIPVNDAEEKKSESYFTQSINALKHFALGSSTHAEAPSQPHSPTEPTNPRLSRSRVPDDWSKPPDANDPAYLSAAALPAKTPLPRGFRKKPEKTASSASLSALDGSSDAARPAIPLKSEFFEWSVEYFREPQMKSTEPEEPGSQQYNALLWRRSRNERILGKTQPLKAMAGTRPWDAPTGSLANGSQPLRLCFHQFEEHLAVADDRDRVCVWNWQEKVRLSRFSNGNAAGSKVNELRFINEDRQALLLTGSSDGVIKIFRDYDEEDDIEVVSAFRGLNNLVPSTKNAGLVLDWQQGQGKLLVSGDVKVVRTWNAATETCTNEIPSRSSSCITAITSDQVAGNVFVAGFGNGKIQVFDQRENPRNSMVKRYSSHKQWITNVHMQRGGMRELLSGSRNGEVKVWDIRMDQELRTIQGTKRTLRTLSVHEHAPVLACGSDAHHVNFFNMNGTFLNSIEPSSSFLHTRATPVASTAFHPHHMMLACASLNDQHVSIFSCGDVPRTF